MSYFSVSFREDVKLGVAKSRSDRLFLLPAVGCVSGWEGEELDLQQGGFPDYLASDLGCRLCSSGLRTLLSEHASTKDRIQWLPLLVNSEHGSRTYNVLHFPEPPDVLSDLSTTVGDMVVKPVLSVEKALGHSVFTFKGSGGLSLMVDTRTKEALEDSGLTGFEINLIAQGP